MQNMRKLFSIFLEYKKYLILFGLICFSLLVYKYFIQSSAMHPPAKLVEVEKLELKNITQQIEFIGTIKSRKQTTLKGRAYGILNIRLKVGQRAKKGELIAQIENNNIERNYQILKEAEEIANQQFERSNSLFKLGMLSRNSIEEKKDALLAVQKRLSDAKIAYEEINIYAPFDGIIGSFKFREGSEIQNGDDIVNFYDPASLIIEFDVPLSIAKQVREGSKVFVEGKEYNLTNIQKMLDPETHMCPADVEVSGEEFTIGSSVEVSLVTKEKENVIVIPFEAIFLNEGKPFVYIASENKATLTPVELGIRNKDLIEIVSGLKVDDELIAQGHHRLYPGTSIEVVAKDSIKKQ